MFLSRRELHGCRGSEASCAFTESRLTNMKITNKLEHDGCVNSVNWNSTGTKVVSGSDDLKVKIWDMEKNKCISNMQSGHYLNIFCVQFAPENDNVVFSCAQDGRLFANHVENESCELIGGLTRSLMHQFSFFPKSWPGYSHSILTASEIGVHLFDTRCPSGIIPNTGEDRNCILRTCRCDETKAVLPFATKPYQYILGGRGNVVQIMDIRKSYSMKPTEDNSVEQISFAENTSPICSFKVRPESEDENMDEEDFYTMSFHRPCISGMALSKDETELLLSFQNDAIYTYDIPSSFTKQTVSPKNVFDTHYNMQTFLKNVNYFGNQEQYIVCGSDCGHIYIYDKNTGAVVAMHEVDHHIANGTAPHPYLPILVAYGIDSDAKVLQV